MYRHTPLARQTPVDACLLIDEEIGGVAHMMNSFTDECQRVLYTLRSRRNASITFHRLATCPSSPLPTIFQLACEHGRDFRTLLDISHTCTYWRELCIATGSLYQDIDISSLPISIANIFADRAPDPISLSFDQLRCKPCDVSGARLLQLSRFFDKHSSNLREVDLALHNLPTWLLSLPVRQLEKLNVKLGMIGSTSFSFSSLPQWKQIQSPPSPVEELFGGETPMLRELSITGFCLKWSAKAYCSLRKLSITVEYGPCSTMQQPIDGILGVLQASPHLEELFLQYPPDIANKAESLHLTPVNLPNLHHVHLALVASDAHRILSAIVGPPHQALFIKTTGWSPNPTSTDIVSIIPTDPRCSLCIGALTHLEINIDPQLFELRGWGPPTFGHRAMIDIELRTIQELRSILQNMIILDLAPNIETLHVVDNTSGANIFTSDDLVWALKLSPRISNLHLTGCVTSILRELTVHIPYSRASFCKALRTLVFCGIVIDEEDVLSLQRCVPGQLCKVNFVECTFGTQDEWPRLQAYLQECGVKEVSLLEPELSLGPLPPRPLTASAPKKNLKRRKGKK